MKRQFSQEDLILMSTKIVSYIVNTILIILLICAVLGGIWLLFDAITTPPTERKKKSSIEHSAVWLSSVSAGQPIILA